MFFKFVEKKIKKETRIKIVKANNLIKKITIEWNFKWMKIYSYIHPC